MRLHVFPHSNNAIAVLATAGWIVAIAAGALDESSSSDPEGFEISLALLRRS